MPSTPGLIVLVGPKQDEHIEAVNARVCASGREVFILDPAEFPGKLKISLGGRVDDMEVNCLSLQRPAAVYLRSLQQGLLFPYAQNDEDKRKNNWRQTLMTSQERNTLLTSMVLRWEELRVPLYNSFTCQRVITKPLQLTLLEQAGLPVPRTLWTNNADHVLRFAEMGPAIYKPIVGGARTRELVEADLAPERLNQLTISPVTFQELLPGDDIRVFVLDGKIIARYQIVTDAIDFRQNEIAINNIKLSAKLEAQCIEACQLLGLRFTGMDLKYDAEGNAKILELNGSPMFLGFDAMAGTNIAGNLVDALLSH